MFILPKDTVTFTKMRLGEQSLLAPYIQEQAVNFGVMAGGFSQGTQPGNMYEYNTVFSANEFVKETSEIEYLYQQTEFPQRIAHSDKKTPGETSDSWLHISNLSATKDVDSKYGEITYMKQFKDRLLIWQEHGVSIASVNERSQVIDTKNMALTLGTGSILSRFDYIIQGSGLKKGQNSIANTIDNLYWWDDLGREIYKYNGQSCTPMSKIGGVSNLISQYDKQNEISQNPKIYTDLKNNEVLFNISINNILSYNELYNQFFSVYTIHPSNAVQFRDNLYLSYTKEDSGVAMELWNTNTINESISGGSKLLPKLNYVVNNNPQYTKTFDTVEFDGDFYERDRLDSLAFTFITPLRQYGALDSKNITNVEYNFRFAVPRSKETIDKYDTEAGQNVRTIVDAQYGNRLRGKTM